MAVLNGGYLVRLLFISLLDLVKKGTREMINKPAAWLVKNKDLGIGYMQTNEPTRMDKLANEYLPLYTHPAKTLTDEEIADFEWAIKNVLNFSQSEKVVGLDNVIRAILRKAQEK